MTILADHNEGMDTIGGRSTAIDFKQIVDYQELVVKHSESANV